MPEPQNEQKPVVEEGCQNPFFRRKNHTEGVKLFIVVKGEKLRICQKCWEEIANGDYEWGDTPKLDVANKDEYLSDEQL